MLTLHFNVKLLESSFLCLIINLEFILNIPCGSNLFFSSCIAIWLLLHNLLKSFSSTVFSFNILLWKFSNIQKNQQNFMVNTCYCCFKIISIPLSIHPPILFSDAFQSNLQTSARFSPQMLQNVYHQLELSSHFFSGKIYTQWDAYILNVLFDELWQIHTGATIIPINVQNISIPAESPFVPFSINLGLGIVLNIYK